MVLLYSIISFLGFLFYLPILLTKKGPDHKGTFIRERLGMASYEKCDIWIHTVSVGETLAALPFLKKLKVDFPGTTIVLSTTTYTGQKVAREKFPEADRIMYIPLDTFFCVNRAVRMINPSVFATVETELWPALFHALKVRGARVIILNGRISDRSFRGYRKIRFFLRSILNAVDFFYMQEKVYAERILFLGADRHRVGVMGNFKFDLSYDSSAPLSWMEGITGKILLAASTHKGEEEVVLEAYRKVKASFDDLTLILAPRHPERFSEAADMITAYGFPCTRRSTLNSESGAASPVKGIVLLDTIGELSRAFVKADVAFIGGSLVPQGGHNIMEPAYWSRPILFGPHMDNFPIAEEFLRKNAALQVVSAEDLASKTSALLAEPDRAAIMGQNAKAIMDRNVGAVEKALQLIRGYIGNS